MTVPDAGSRLTAEPLAAACPGFGIDGCACSGTPAQWTNILRHAQHHVQQARAKCAITSDHNVHLAVVAAC